MEKGCDVIYECSLREKILAIQGQGYERRREELAQTLPLDLTPSNKHGTNFDDHHHHHHVPPSHPPTLFLEMASKTSSSISAVEHFIY